MSVVSHVEVKFSWSSAFIKKQNNYHDWVDFDYCWSLNVLLMSPQKVFGWSNFSLKSRTSKSRKFFSVVDVDNLIVYLRKTWLGSSSPKIWLKLSPFALSREEALWVLTKCLRSSISNLIWDTDVFNWQIPYQALIPRYFSEGSHKELEALDNIKWII